LLTQEEKNSLYFHGKLSEINGNPVPVIPGSQKINDNNTIFILGDELQAPYSIEEEEKSPKLSEFAQHAFTLTSVKRTSSIDIFKIQNIFRSESVGLNTKLPLLSKLNYSDNKGVKKGVRLNNDKTSFINEAKEAVRSNKGFIITYDADYYNQMIADLPKEVHNRVYYMTDKKMSPQGLTLEGEVYVYLPYDEMTNKKSIFKSNPKYFNRYALTAVSRAKTFVSLYTGNGLGNESSNLVEEDKLVMFEDKPLETATRMKELYDRYSGVSSNLIDIPLSKTGATGNTDQEEVVIKDDEKKDPENEVKEEEVKEDEKIKDEQEEEDSDFVNVDDQTDGESVSDDDKQDAAEKEVTDYQRNKIKAKAKARREAVKKERKKQSKEKEYDISDANPSEAKEDDFVQSEGSSGKPTTGITNKIITDVDQNEVTAIVTPSGFIIKKGATYFHENGEKVTVNDIKYDKNNDVYYVETSREKLPLTVEAFENTYKKPIKEKEYNNTALANMISNGILTIYGNALPTDMFELAGTNQDSRKEMYNQALKKMIKDVSNKLGQKFKVTVTVVKNKTFVIYNGKTLPQKELALKVTALTSRGETIPLGFLFIDSKDTAVKAGKNAEQNMYNDFLYELLKNKNDGDVIADNVPVDKNDAVIMNSVIGFDSINKGSFTTYAELEKLASDIG
jgi:hypothetical protein